MLDLMRFRITLFTEVGKLVWAPISVPFSIPPAMRYRIKTINMMDRKTILRKKKNM